MLAFSSEWHLMSMSALGHKRSFRSILAQCLLSANSSHSVPHVPSRFKVARRKALLFYGFHLKTPYGAS